jgi:hypothetical protein
MSKQKQVGDFLVVMGTGGYAGIYRKPRIDEKPNCDFGIAMDEIKGFRAACDKAQAMHEALHPAFFPVKMDKAKELARLNGHKDDPNFVMYYMGLTTELLDHEIQRLRGSKND